MSMRDEITDNEIQKLINTPKFIRDCVFSNIKIIRKYGFTRFNLEVCDKISGNSDFELFFREAIDDLNDFSVGLRYKFKDGSEINLMRCNGFHSTHRNKIERTSLAGRHIHIATERYIKKGLDAESFAIEADNEYNDADSAFAHLIRKCNIYIEGFDLLNMINPVTGKEEVL